MDIVTQALLGGVLAQAVAGRDEKKPASLAGAAAGLLAEADGLIRSSSDPLLTIEYHRHFTHSLFFVPFGAGIAMLVLWPFLRRHLALARLYLFCLAGYSMSGVLDACTSYGTLLFWPFYNERIALNIISIVDPVFTLALLVALLAGLVLKERKYAVHGLLFCLAYLSLGLVQLTRAEFIAELLISKREHTALQRVVKPTLANLVLWRSVYMDEERIYVDAIRPGFFGEGQIYIGESLPRFSTEEDLPWLDSDTLLYEDIQRFQRFSRGFLAIDPTRSDVIGDIRYSMLPTSALPLWGIVIDRDDPGQHADYRFFRQSTKAARQDFIDLVLGREVKMPQ